MSFSFVGRVYSSLKGFYNEINPATLTGAIDVVIVKQKDGSYHSSPFHVRFGKLGVLRAREKIVDIEINGQPVGLHMKLGEAGEAFFVQEFTEDEEEMEFPADLATSPIESGDELMAEGLAQLQTQCHQQQLQEQLQHHANTEQHPQPSSQEQQQALLPHALPSEEQPPSLGSPPTDNAASVTLDLSTLAKEMKSDSSYEEDKNKGKRRRKVLKKKKQKYSGARSSPRSQSMPEGLGLEHDHIFEMEVTESTSEDEEVAGYSLGASRSASLDMKKLDTQLVKEDVELPLKECHINSLDTLLAPFSDPEMSPPVSPLPSRPPSPKSDTEVDRQHAEENQQKMLQISSTTWNWGQFPKQTSKSPDVPPSKDQIDSVLERQDSEKVSSGGILSLWGRKKAQKTSTPAIAGKKETTIEEKGMYLDDLTSLEDPEIAKLYLGSPRFQSIREREHEDDSESGRGASLPQSPHSVDGAIGGTVSFLESEVRHLGTVSMSLCGGLSDSDGITLDKFMKKVITYDDLVEQPSILGNPDLVVKVRDGYFNWTTAAPMVLCEMAFNKQMPESAVSSLVKKHMPKKTLKKKGSGLSWWSWRSSTNQNAEGATEDASLPVSPAPLSGAIPISGTSVTSDNEAMSSKVSESSLSPLVSPATSPPTSVHGTPRKQKSGSKWEAEQRGTETDTDNSEKETTRVELPPPSDAFLPPSSPPSQSMPASTSSAPVAVPTPSPSVVLPSSTATMSPTSRSSDSPSSATCSPQEREGSQGMSHVKINIDSPSEKYFKTLRLTSEQVGKLNLREGQNEITFSVTTQYQGTSRCVSHIYLWNYYDKIVISDIDGTITKSDVMGQILPLIGRDWSQSGVAELFTRLSNNGYKLLYLSARAIGQSRITKELLRNIKQGELVLPDGPLLLNPTSLISAFHREVIVKNPEEFKIHCLKDIAELFPSSPFYAGFGNKVNDVIAYRALQIPSFRIFTINPQGQLRHEFSHTFLSSYSKMSNIADHFFPPIVKGIQSTSNEYSNVNYWRNPPKAIGQMELDKLKEADEISNNSRLVIVDASDLTPIPSPTAPIPITSTTTPSSDVISADTAVSINMETTVSNPTTSTNTTATAATTATNTTSTTVTVIKVCEDGAAESQS